MKTALLSHALTACVCVPATVAVAPHIQHAIERHRAPVVHHARVTRPAVPSATRVVYLPCAALAPTVSLGAAVERIQGALDDVPAAGGEQAGYVAAADTGSPAVPYTPIWPVGPGPILVVSPPPVVPPPPTSRVPEPATWGLLVAGFGMAGVAMRNRKRAAGDAA